MNIVRNQKLIDRNAKIGKITSFVSLAILGLGMYITFTQPERVALSLLALLTGFLLSQVGIYFTNRWGKQPRPDQQLDRALKGFGKQYSLYHYTTRASHVLVGPAGVWTLHPKSQRGTIMYKKNRWRKKGGGLMGLYLKIFAQESLGRPDLEIPSDQDALRKQLEKNLPAEEVPDLNAALIFTHPEVEIDADEAPTPTLHAKQLKDYLRKFAKDKPISTPVTKAVQDALDLGSGKFKAGN